jgi:SnoaL-like protein
VSFFERYFAALDGPDPASALELVSDNLRFAVLFSTDASGHNRQILGGRAELAAYIQRRGDPGRRHHILGEAVDGDTELAWGETRHPDGSLAATFVGAARLDSDGRLLRYIAGRTPAIRFPAAR